MPIPVSSGAGAYCSPAQVDDYERDRTCFSRDALVRLARAWNEHCAAGAGSGETSGAERGSGKTEGARGAGPIRGVATATKRELWRELNKRLYPVCGDGKEWCWPEKISSRVASQESVRRMLRPKKPREWKKRPYAWLSNYDIEDVMRQYDFREEDDYKYRFLGVFPIDFESKNVFGQCLFEEVCSIRLDRLYRKGVRYLGMITNLDRHDESGSHWTSLFLVIDPALPSFGAYYYDSVASPPPPEILRFVERIRAQALALPGAAGKVGANGFGFQTNTVRHQYANTECGVFSMVYQIRWLEALRRDRMAADFQKIVRIRMRDEDVHKLRDVLYRPEI